MHILYDLSQIPHKNNISKILHFDIVTLSCGPHKHEKLEFCCVCVLLLQLDIYHSIYQQDY